MKNKVNQGAKIQSRENCALFNLQEAGHKRTTCPTKDSPINDNARPKIEGEDGEKGPKLKRYKLKLKCRKLKVKMEAEDHKLKGPKLIRV